MAQDGRDRRFRDTKFIKAPAIFANNDVKYETNKLRARQYAASEGKAVTYACAKDTPSADAGAINRLRARKTIASII